MRLFRHTLFQRLGLAVLLVSSAVGPLCALETSSPEMLRSKATSSLDEASLKPLFLFDMRGRKDPFMAYLLLTNSPESSKAVDVDELVFTGMVEVQGKDIALFSGDGGKAYILRGNSLFDPEDKIVSGIRGSITERESDNEVVLTQGERKLSFTCQRLSKRLDQDSQP